MFPNKAIPSVLQCVQQKRTYHRNKNGLFLIELLVTTPTHGYLSDFCLFIPISSSVYTVSSFVVVCGCVVVSLATARFVMTTHQRSIELDFKRILSLSKHPIEITPAWSLPLKLNSIEINYLIRYTLWRYDVYNNFSPLWSSRYTFLVVPFIKSNL